MQNLWQNPWATMLIHIQTKRGLDIDAIGNESYIKWNGPPVHLAAQLGKASLDKKFGGRSKWNFVKKKW